jgi:glycosyltransferase involved in cell wall biosynthesis
MILITAIILTKNEEKNIETCINSVAFCDETMVIDDNSTDSTVSIVKKMGAIVHKRKLDDFSSQRNFALEKASGRWCLFIDADEKVTSGLKNEIIEKINIKDNHVVGYFIKRKDLFNGRELKYGEWGNVYLLRLARRSAGKWIREVHEYWDILGRTEKLKYILLHNPHSSMREFIYKVNKYTTLHAKANNNEHKSSSLFKIIFLPMAKFIKIYLIKLGILDGEIGLMNTFIMSLHSFLAWSKLWMIQNKRFQKY